MPIPRSPVKALVATLLFVMSFVASGPLVRKLPIREGRYPREALMPEIDVPRGREYFFASAPHELSQSILYHDLGDSIANARRADVLFLGNSLMPLALREEFLVPKAGRLGVRLFSLGVGHAENGRFPLEVIRKHDLRPKIVVVNATAGFFDRRGRFSPPAREAMEGTRWDAMKRVIEGIGSWRIQLLVHSFLPKLDFLDQRMLPKAVMYRSSRTGWWYPALEPRSRYPVRINPPEKNFDHLLPFAREYKRELDERGTLLVLTHIPGGKTYLAHLPLLTRELGVPLVAPKLDGLQTTDGAHLDRESARRFSAAFWKGFIALPEVRTALGLDSPRDDS